MVRSRERKPPPHGLLHSDQGPNALYSQSIGAPAAEGRELCTCSMSYIGHLTYMGSLVTAKRKGGINRKPFRKKYALQRS